MQFCDAPRRPIASSYWKFCRPVFFIASISLAVASYRPKPSMAVRCLFTPGRRVYERRPTLFACSRLVSRVRARDSAPVQSPHPTAPQAHAVFVFFSVCFCSFVPPESVMRRFLLPYTWGPAGKWGHTSTQNSHWGHIRFFFYTDDICWFCFFFQSFRFILYSFFV